VAGVSDSGPSTTILASGFVSVPRSEQIMNSGECAFVAFKTFQDFNCSRLSFVMTTATV
jgi:hypothetical protein